MSLTLGEFRSYTQNLSDDVELKICDSGGLDPSDIEKLVAMADDQDLVCELRLNGDFSWRPIAPVSEDSCEGDDLDMSAWPPQFHTNPTIDAYIAHRLKEADDGVDYELGDDVWEGDTCAVNINQTISKPKDCIDEHPAIAYV